MVADHIRRLFTYNAWAWRQVFASLDRLDEATQRASRPFFWDSLWGLTVHGFVAEQIWLRRCQGVSPTTLPAADDFADLAALLAAWRPVTAGWDAYLAPLDDAALATIIAYRNTSGEPYQLALRDLTQHVINHATEHRSQLTPVLAQLDAPTPPLDYVYYVLAQE